MMQKVFAYLMFFCVTLSSTELHEALRLPHLWEHFTEHKSDNESLTFFAFLEQHYTDSHASEAGDSDNHNLPFKSHECSTILKCSDKNKDIEALTSPAFGILQHSTPLDSGHLPSGYSGAIWQPPQVC